jgi:putative ABC transport system substrate-binding protein
MQFGHLKRREFMSLLGGTGAAWPLHARAQQQPAKPPTVGFLSPNAPLAQSQWTAAFVQRLRELGWIEGRTVAIEYRWAEGQIERLGQIASELVQAKVDVIVTAGTPAIAAARQATALIPVVFALSGDPVGSGAVAALARPGGNVTGLSSRLPIPLASGSNCCAKLSPVSAGWQSWAMSASMRPCSTWIR